MEELKFNYDEDMDVQGIYNVKFYSIYFSGAARNLKNIKLVQKLILLANLSERFWSLYFTNDKK